MPPPPATRAGTNTTRSHSSTDKLRAADGEETPLREGRHLGHDHDLIHYHEEFSFWFYS